MRNIGQSKSVLSLVSILFLLGSLYGAPQSKKARTTSKPTAPVKGDTSTNTGVAPQPLDTSGLKAAKLFEYVYDGRFERMKDSRTKRPLGYGVPDSNPNTISKPELALAYLTYVRSFSDICHSSLPKDKVEITSLVEEYDTQIKPLISSRGIVGSYPVPVYKGSRTVNSGIYADPKYIPAYKAKNLVLGLVFTGRVLEAMEGKDLKLDDILVFALDVLNDNYRFLTKHGCNSPTVKHFAENLLRVANGQPSIQEQSGQGKYFVRLCQKKLPEIIGTTNANACGCLHNVFQSNLDLKFLLDLEDKFDTPQFLFTSFSVSGLHLKVSDCLR